MPGLRELVSLSASIRSGHLWRVIPDTHPLNLPSLTAPAASPCTLLLPTSLSMTGLTDQGCLTCEELLILGLCCGKAGQKLLQPLLLLSSCQRAPLLCRNIIHAQRTMYRTIETCSRALMGLPMRNILCTNRCPAKPALSSCHEKRLLEKCTEECNGACSSNGALCLVVFLFSYLPQLSDYKIEAAHHSRSPCRWRCHRGCRWGCPGRPGGGTLRGPARIRSGTGTGRCARTPYYTRAPAAAAHKTMDQTAIVSTEQAELQGPDALH